MKRLKIAVAAIAIGLTCPVVQAQDWGSLLKGGIGLVKSFTISDNQVKEYVHQFVVQSDKENKVADSNSAYGKRLSKIVSGIDEVEGQPLNFKVYITKDINAFACADGSVRVYSGLMDVMNDDEVLGVIGHEIGHVAHHDTKNAMKTALRTTAFRDVLGADTGVIGTLSKSQLGALGETLVNSKYSQSQESNADTYAYHFLKENGKNPLVLALAFKKLGELESSGKASLVQKLFSSHPETSKRISKIEKLAFAEGYTYPETTNNSTSKKGKK
ncbi:MAG: M48 family metallopeptidase [Candidatus Amulumruptor caecigallinarius]|nr:M48 family metallopeptidase [Candidatus Amulumruptor caecigallinarius]